MLGTLQYVGTEPGRTPLGLEEAHRRFHITPEEFDEVAAELGQTLVFVGVPKPEREEVLAAFAHKAEVTIGLFSPVMRRMLLGLLGLYVLAGIVTSAAESTGMLGRTCGCRSDCWCKRPGMNLFRWVTRKKWHRLQSPADKTKPPEV